MAGNFENSYLGNIIGTQRQKINDFTNSRLKRVKQMNQRATSTINQQRTKSRNYNARLMAKHGAGYDIAGALAKQRELVNKGYKLAIDGDWGKQSEAAWQNYQKQKQKKLQDADNARFYQTSSAPKLNWFGRNIVKPIVDLVNGTPDEQRASQNSYANSKPWRYKDDVYTAFDKDRTGHKVGGSRMGDLGLVPNGDGTYSLYNPKTGKVTQCAMTRNQIERVLGPHKTDMNAWDGRGVYGDSTIFNGYKYLPKVGGYNKVTHTLQNLAASAAVQANFNNIDFQQGDMVDLYSANSAHNDEAWNNGTLNRSNSHTGVVIQPDHNNKRGTYILHNVNGTISLDPISKFMVSEQGPALDWGITGVHRPGTKEHPYKDKNGNYVSK